MSEKRLDKLNAYLDENPSDLFLLFAVAKEHEKLNDSELARQKYEQILKLDPSYLGMYLHYAQNLILNSMIHEAKTVLELGINEAQRQKDQRALSELLALKSTLPET